MFTKEKPHRRFAGAHGIAFWNGNVAGDEDTATRAVVHLGGPGMPYPEFEFKWPEQKNDVERLETALMKAFHAGIYEGKKQVRDALGILPQR